MASSVFEKVPSELDFPKEEHEVLAFWKEQNIFERSLEQRKTAPPFVFYEGPPTANGLPHNGHVLTRVIKDVFPRYKTMRGFYVPRKAGWDTHGLPVEVEVEKELRIHGKAAIVNYGVEPFIRRCIESVFRYTHEWESLTERVGFWVDLPTAYVTYHRSYVESVWWALSELYKKGLLYQGHKVVWWWAQGGTALSSGEVGLGYKEVDDPSVYVAFPLKEKLDGSDAALLVWTTTPWTLPSNMFAAVRPEFEYALVSHEGRRLLIARSLLEALEKKLKCKLSVERELKGVDLIGREYTAPYASDYEGAAQLNHRTKTRDGKESSLFWRVIAGDFVTLDTGTGIVHVAPAFGEDDYQAYVKDHAAFEAGSGLNLLCAVDPDGTFNARLPEYKGRWVKDCDKQIADELKQRGLLVHRETYKHDYPFCWRADSDPLIQYARPAWYIKTTAFKDKAIANNRAVRWLPDHIKEGRFGDFLAHNVDWALSRERYWGTPLNVWTCTEQKAHKRVPASVAEILALNPNAFDHFHAARKADPSLSEHLIVHKPWIDAVVFPCPECGKPMKREPEVIDCWFDSGCMPFAQWGFPHQGREQFLKSFPADFISEAIDQTRGWFYSLLMISTLVFDEECQERLQVDPVRPLPHPYKTCIVLGHVSDKEGKKESKSKGNYTPPDIILDRVAMDFAVLSRADAEKIKGVSFKHEHPDMAFIASEDLEGLDLREGAKVQVTGPKGSLELTLPHKKGLPRRVVVIDERHYAQLGVCATKTPDVKPAEVFRLPTNERVTISDPNSPAPGADAFRWFFYASSPPWNATRHSLSNVRALQKEFLVKLRNVYSFFTIYANIDGFDPWSERAEPVRFDHRAELDRWILGELSRTTQMVTKRMDDYDIYGATQLLSELVDALSNWYVRRTRARFWRSGWDEDKAAAYQTLYEVLVTTAKLIAPFVPFTAEKMYQNLVAGPGRHAKVDVPKSVHLLMYPRADDSRFRDALARTTSIALSGKIKTVRELVSVGLQVRTQSKLKVRQPLRSAHIVLNQMTSMDALIKAEALIKDELNVLELYLVSAEQAESFGHYTYKPNFRSLGQRGLGKQAQELKAAWANPSAEVRSELDAILLSGRGTHRGIELVREDIEAFFETKEGFAAAGDRVGVVILDTKLDDELRDLGLARELQSRVQAARKEMGLEYTDRIGLHVDVSRAPNLRRAIEKHEEHIKAEVLAARISFEAALVTKNGAPFPFDVDGEEGTMTLLRV